MRQSRLGEIDVDVDVDEVTEIITDAWAARVPRRLVKPYFEGR